MPILIFINTSGPEMTIALSKGATIIAEKSHDDAKQQAAVINLLIQDLLFPFGIELKDLSGICICAGPGSYTGLRVGLSTAKGIAYALNKRIMLFDKLTLIAQSFQEQEYNGFDKLVFLKAREREYFFGHFDENNTLKNNLQHTFYEDIERVLSTVSSKTYYITDDEELNLNFDKFEIDEHFRIDIEAWLFSAIKRIELNEWDDVAYSEPLYLKKAFTTTSKKKLL